MKNNDFNEVINDAKGTTLVTVEAPVVINITSQETPKATEIVVEQSAAAVAAYNETEDWESESWLKKYDKILTNYDKILTNMVREAELATEESRELAEREYQKCVEDWKAITTSAENPYHAMPHDIPTEISIPVVCYDSDWENDHDNWLGDREYEAKLAADHFDALWY